MRIEMTPQEKAQALISKFSNLINFDFVSDRQWHSPIDEERNRRVKKDAIRCALATVEEIILANPHSNPFNTDVYSTMDYWLQVQEEIKNYKP